VLSPSPPREDRPLFLDATRHLRFLPKPCKAAPLIFIIPAAISPGHQSSGLEETASGMLQAVGLFVLHPKISALSFGHQRKMSSLWIVFNAFE
jgi:hypothetical protein